jgi:hypothetical protein
MPDLLSVMMDLVGIEDDRVLLPLKGMSATMPQLPL